MTIDKSVLSRLLIEPLDRHRHDRAVFSCGVDRLDNFLKITATRYVEADDGRIYVASLPPSQQVVGFYALSPHAIERGILPDEKKLPRHEKISAIYLSMIAVDTRVQGQGVGSFLTAAALAKCVDIADMAGGRFVVLDALNDSAARLYRRLGFVDLPSKPLRMIIAMSTVRKSMGRPSTVKQPPGIAQPPDVDDRHGGRS